MPSSSTIKTVSPLLQLSLLRHTVEAEQEADLNDGDDFDMLEEYDDTDHLGAIGAAAPPSLDRRTSGGLLGVNQLVVKDDYMENQF